MKSYVKLIIIAIVAGGGAAHAANETVTMNAIDAGGIGKEIGTIELSDTEAGLRVTPRLAGLPPGDHGRIAVPATRQTDNPRPAWRLAATTIQRIPASTSGHWARAIKGTCQR